MTNALTTQTRSMASPMSIAPKYFGDQVARYRGYVETTASGKHQISALNAPSANELVEIEQRRALVLGWLRSAPIESVENGWRRSFFGSQRPAFLRKARRRSHKLMLASCRASQFGRSTKHASKSANSGARFRPSAPEIRKWVEAECAPAFHEAETLHVIITAERYEPRTEAERARVKTAFTEFIAGWPDPKRNGRKTVSKPSRMLPAASPTFKARSSRAMP